MSDCLKNKRYGIFGGSFDPPHIAHALAVLYALIKEDLNKVIIVPCLKHPFDKCLAPYKNRIEMCRIAFDKLHNGVEISEIEGEQGGISYTINTILCLKNRYPDADFKLIIGSDILNETHKWKDFDRIKKEVSFLILPRPPIDLKPACSQTTTQEPLINLPGSPYFLPDISATQIRGLIKQGKDISEYVCPEIAEYISKNKLYI